MFSHQYESKVIKFYYSTSTISYTPWFPYQFKMTLIECSRIQKDRSLAEATRHRAAMTARSSQITPRTGFQHPGLRSVVVLPCPNVYHSSESKSDSVQSMIYIEPASRPKPALEMSYPRGKKCRTLVSFQLNLKLYMIPK